MFGISKTKKKSKFYMDNIELLKGYQVNKIFSENETIRPISILHDNDIIYAARFSFDDCKKNNVIYYISDLHLDDKILKKFPKNATKEKITKYINDIVLDIVDDLEDRLFFNNYLLIGGDVSYSFEISKIFYELLVNNINSVWKNNIIVILGNHELWEDGNIDITIKKYRELFNNLEINFLNNEMLCIKGPGLVGNFVKISENDINNYTDEQLKTICLDSKLLILGGIGYSGLNSKFNANCGLYRGSIKTLEDDKILSSRFEKIYLKLKRVLNKEELIVFTHMPKYDWSKDTYKNNWVYVNGHTHRNEYYKDDERIVYADNQIGYHNEDFGLKHFNTSRKYDIFKYYDDGIYQISVEEYINFVYGNGIKMEYNRDDGIINMLKKDGIYCFLLKLDNNKLYLLDGGKRCKLNIQDINYYYENMSYYSNKIKDSTNRISTYMKEISLFVKSFGGAGTIHGCIIDIDFYNHLYVNIYDGTITPYYAINTRDKYPYKDLSTLLLNIRPDLYLNYKKMTSEKNSVIPIKNDEIKRHDFEYYEDTAIYRESKIMKSLQYLLNDNIIRIWSDDFINNHGNLETLLIENKKWNNL